MSINRKSMKCTVANANNLKQVIENVCLENKQNKSNWKKGKLQNQCAYL